MASPFPGMDPYIEDPEVWSDFQAGFPPEIRAALNRVLQPRYVSRIRVCCSYGEDAPLDQYWVEVLQTTSRRLVTAIEILSPVNKRPGHDAYTDYLRKRQALINSDAHLIEIDLLRAGTRPPLEREVPPAPYYVTLSREERRPQVDVWPIQLWDKLPEVPVPLLAPDPDVTLRLGDAVAAVYERGAYDRLIDYTQPPPPPPLSEEEAAWVGEYLRALKLR